MQHVQGPAEMQHSEGKNMTPGNERLIWALGEQKIEWQTSHKERMFLLGIAALLRPELVVELGIFKGGFTQHLVYFCERLICVDNTKRFETLPPKANFLLMSTDDFFASHPDLMADLIIVDACHDTDCAYRDLKNSIEHARVVVMHDTILSFTRRGYVQALQECRDKISFYDLDAVEYSTLEYPGLRNEIWGGIGIVVMK
jgi:hypothetical protein